MGFYCMVDRPPQRPAGKRFNNKPRREHKTLEIAEKEAIRLTKKLKSRVLVLEVIKIVIPLPLVESEQGEDEAYERAAARARSNDFEDTDGKDWT